MRQARLGVVMVFFGGFLARSIRGGWWKTNTIGKCEKNRANLTLQMFG